MTTRDTNVLVVEDDLPTLNLERLILEGGGYTVTATARGEEAIEMVADASPDLVLLDIGLPGIDGFTTCKVIRKFSRVPIIMVTGSGALGDKVRGLDTGADDYITKPFSEKELFARSKAVLRRSDERGGAFRQIARFRREVLRRISSIDYAEESRAAWRQFVGLCRILRDASLALAAAIKQRTRRGLNSSLAQRVKSSGPAVKMGDAAAKAQESELAQRMRADAALLWSSSSTSAREFFGRRSKNGHRSSDHRQVATAPVPDPEATGSPETAEATGNPHMMFLDELLRGYLREAETKYSDPMISAPVLPLVDVYQQMLASSRSDGEYSREQFARDVYLLHCSGIDCTPTGARVQFPISRGVPNKTLIVTDDDGREVKYYGVRFSQTEGGDHQNSTPSRSFDDAEVDQYRAEIQEAFSQQLEWPSEGFARLLASQLNFGDLEQREVRQFAQITRDALRELVKEPASDEITPDAAG